jgi:uncharacterized OB-fold protein
MRTVAATRTSWLAAQRRKCARCGRAIRATRRLCTACRSADRFK